MLSILRDQSGAIRNIATLMLMLMASYVCVIALFRLIQLRRMKTSMLRMLPELGRVLAHQRTADGIKLCRSSAYSSHLAKIVGAALLELENCRAISMPEPETALSVREGMERTAAVVSAELKEDMGLFDAMGRTAPFVGVLAGTPITLAAGTLLSLLTIWWSVVIKARTERIEVELKLFSSEMRQFMGLHGQCSLCEKPVRNLHRNGKIYACGECCAVCN